MGFSSVCIKSVLRSRTMRKMQVLFLIESLINNQLGFNLHYVISFQ